MLLCISGIHFRFRKVTSQAIHLKLKLSAMFGGTHGIINVCSCFIWLRNRNELENGGSVTMQHLRDYTFQNHPFKFIQDTTTNFFKKHYFILDLWQYNIMTNKRWRVNINLSFKITIRFMYREQNYISTWNYKFK